MILICREESLISKRIPPLRTVFDSRCISGVTMTGQIGDRDYNSPAIPYRHGSCGLSRIIQQTTITIIIMFLDDRINLNEISKYNNVNSSLLSVGDDRIWTRSSLNLVILNGRAFIRRLYSVYSLETSVSCTPKYTSSARRRTSCLNFHFRYRSGCTARKPKVVRNKRITTTRPTRVPFLSGNADPAAYSNLDRPSRIHSS